MTHKVLFMAAILMALLPIRFSFSQQGGPPWNPPIIGIEVNGWNFMDWGGLGYIDSAYTGTMIEPGLSVEDSVQRFDMYGISEEYGLQKRWEKIHFKQAILPWPRKISMWCNVLGVTNVQGDVGLMVDLYDTTGGGGYTFIGRVLPIVPDWQYWERTIIPTGFVSVAGMRIGFALPTALDSVYCGITVQVNDIYFHFENGDSLLVDAMELDWPTSVEPVPNLIPSGYVLHQNYPNPFNPSTVIRYEIPERSPVSLGVYDLLGQEVATLVDAEQPAGVYEVNFNTSGSGLPSGMYVAALSINGQPVQSRKMTLLK